MRVCLFESRWEHLEPLSCTRPVFDLVCGATTLSEKQRRWFGANDWGVCIRPQLAALYRHLHPGLPVNEYGWLLSAPVVLVNGRWLPPAHRLVVPETPCVGMAGADVAWVVLGDDQLRSLSFPVLDQLLGTWQTELPRIDAGGHVLEYPWHLVEHNGHAIAQDVAAGLTSVQRAAPSALTTVGPPEQVFVAGSARIDPFVVADSTQGPIVIDEYAFITSFTRLEGPCYIGRHAQVHGAKIRPGTTIGPHCRVGGEVEASIIHGFSNKYHEGFLGHSYVGEWVNLGAGTHNSDLRNDYGPVSVPLPSQVIRTGLNKVGCFIGDHVKTGLGTLINTGTYVGAFSNLLPAGRLAPKYVPAFATWWNGELREQFPLAQLLQTAQTMMQRRGQQLSEEHVAFYRSLFEATADDRRRHTGGELRVWPRSA